MRKNVISLFAIYHFLALLADAEQVMVNVRRARDQPSLDSVVKLLIAEGVLLRALE